MDRDGIGVAVVGAGWMGATLLQRLVEREDVHLVGLCQRNGKRARRLLEDLGQPNLLYEPDFDKLLATEGLDAVVLASPNYLHGSQAIASMRAGKHVFCEKPAATRYADFLEELELDKRSPGQISFVDYLLYFDSFQQRLRTMVANGDMGQISQIQVN